MIRIIALTPAGKTLGEKLRKLLAAQADNAVELCYKPQPFAAQVQGYFQQGDRLVFICATGIVMRSLAPVLQDKYRDPPVLVLDENGQFVIPLLSGHEGGANQWASELAALLEAQAVITSACDYLNPIYAVGMGCERGCPVEELEALLRNCLEQAKLQLSDISEISSIDIKADEQGLIALAARLGKPYRTWSVNELQQVEPLLNSRSEYVFNTVGVYGVAESAALVSAQMLGQALDKSTLNASAPELVLVKQKTSKATCAIARVYRQRKD